MALNQDNLEKVKKLLKEIENSYNKLGQKSPFDQSAEKIAASEKEIRKLEIALEGVQKKVNELEDGFGGITAAIGASLAEMNKTDSSFNRAIKSMRGIKSITSDLANEQAGLTSLSLKELKNKEDKLKTLALEVREQADIVKKQYEGFDQDEKGNKLSEEVLKNKLKQKGLTEQDFQKIQSILIAQQEGLKILDEAINKTEKRVKLEEKINKQIGVFGGILKGINKIPILGNVFDANEAVSKMEEHLREVDENGKQINTTTSTLSVGFKNIGNQIKTGMLNPANLVLGAIALLIKALISVGKQTGELAKSFGTSYSEASSLRSELNTIANLSGDVNINTANLQKSLIAINKEFGTAAKLNGELLKDYTQLTEVAGYTNEAAAGLSKITIATGGDLSDNTAQILGQATAFNAINGLALNEKEIVEDIAKVSSAVTLSLGMQPKELAKAVLQAKALGTTLDKVEQIASSLLDFESSIQNELEAELLTGKAINLEVAREASLRGDLATVASEIANQIGTAADFTNMNVKAQEALAKSVGMTRDDLAASLIEREALAKIGMQDKTALQAYNELKKQGLSDEQIATKLGDKNLAAQLKSQSVQEKFIATTEKLQEIFVNLATPILQIVSPFMEIFSMVAGLAGGIGPFIKYLGIGYGILKGTQITLKGMLAISTLISALKKGDIASETTILTTLGLQNAARAFSLTQKMTGNTLTAIDAALNQTILGSIIAQGFGIIKNIGKLGIELGVRMGIAAASLTANAAATFGVGAAIALAAAGAAYVGLKAMTAEAADDMISSPSGYGSRTLIGPEGAIALNDKDTVIAGTNLFPEDKTNSPSSPSISMNLEPLIQEMQGLKDGIERLISLVAEGGDVFIDGTKVGKTLSLASSKMG